MTLSRRSLLAGLLAAPAAATLASCSQSGGGAGGGGDLTSITYGYIPDFNGTSLLAIANDQKLWQSNGLKADLKSFTNGPLQIQAMGTGDLDFGYIGPGAMWLPATGKASLLTLNGVGKADRVIAQPGITSVADLRGKKVAVPEGTSGDMILQLALQKAGMSIADVDKVAMDASTVVAAFSSQQVDAAGIWYPMISTIKQKVPNLVELAKNDDFEDVMAFPNVMVAGPDYPTQHEDTTIKVLKVLRAAMDYRVDHLDETIDLVAKMNQTPADAVRADAANGKYYRAAELDSMTADKTIDKWFTAMNKFFQGNGKIQGTAVAPADYYKGDLFTRAGQ